MNHALVVYYFTGKHFKRFEGKGPAIFCEIAPNINTQGTPIFIHPDDLPDFLEACRAHSIEAVDYRGIMAAEIALLDLAKEENE